VTKIEMIFFYSGVGWGVRRYGEGGMRWWCGFNASVLASEERRPDEALPEDEARAVSSS
jgi:hypothetical protein